jgi:hypothetical protein
VNSIPCCFIVIYELIEHCFARIIIYKRLYLHLNNNILVSQQFGFREKLSTEMAIYTFLSTILLSLDKNTLLVDYFVACKRLLTMLIMIYF